MANTLQLSLLSGLDETEPHWSARVATLPYRKALIRLLVKRKPYLLENENYYLRNVLSGSNLNPNQISPAIRFCNSRSDYDLFDFLSMWSSFPAANRPGRRFKFFIVDAGHEGSPIMALGCLSSSIRLLRARDEWIGWHGAKWKETRARNLAFMLDLSTCVGIPPYSYLTSGKLLCYTCLSKEIRDAYSKRYASQRTMNLGRFITDIALIVVLGAFSRNTPQYKGISVNGIKYFRFVGYTKGYSTFHIPRDYYDELLSTINIEALGKRRRLDGGGNPKLRMLRIIARRLHLDEENFVRSGYRRAVFVAPLAHNSTAFLLGEDERLDYFDYSFEDVVEAWKQKWLWRRCEKGEVLEKVNTFTPSLLSLKRELAQQD